MEFILVGKSLPDDDDEALIDAAIAALGDDLLGATVVTSARDTEGDEEAWISAIGSALEDLPEDSDVDAVSVFERLRATGVIDWRYAVGTDVWAVLDEDDEWHEARVSAVQGTRHEVTFVEWPKQQTVERDALCAMIEDDGPSEHGTCATCSRELPLSFHHLIPKEVHHQWVGKEPPFAYRRDHPEKAQILLTRTTLGSHGILVCRPCHSAIHRSASNRELAARYCTRTALLEENAAFARFVEYARRRR